MLFDDPALRQLKQNFDSVKEKKEGFVKATDRGFGFLEVDRESFFIAPNDMRNVTHGDRIIASVEEDGTGRKHAIPEKLVESFLKRFIAKVLIIQGKLYVVPDHPNITFKIAVDDNRADKSAKLNNGDWVVCNLTAHALAKKFFKATLDEYICSKDDPKTPWTVSLRRYDLPLQEPADQDLPFLEADLARKDLRDVPFVTIDSAHTEDMDDALFIEKDGDKFILHVAIADPTGYISEDSDLNTIASHRAFSIYLPGRDIPMLPRNLSQNLCSLRYNEDRPTVVGSITVAADGAIEFDKTTFELATIRSHGKLVYNDISDYLEGKADATFKPTEEIAKVLEMLVEFTKLRDGYRSTHAATFRNKPDYEFVLNDKGALDHIEVNHRRIANQIVEESMITANVAAGELLAQKLNCGIFNSHKGFDLLKKQDILKLLAAENCPVNEDSLSTIEGYNAIRRFANEQENNYLDSRIRRLQEYSQMSIAPAAHYALGVSNYATWTSPIRKYGDMINHRLLKSIIVSTEHPKMPDEDTLLIMNTARRTNRMAERDVRDWLYVDYLEPEIAKKTAFEAEIFDISRGGLRVILNANGAMIFVPGSFISQDKTQMTLDGENGMLLVNGQIVLRLGDTIKVKVVEVNKVTRSVTGAPVESVGGLMLPDPYVPRDRRGPQRSNGPRNNNNNRGNFRR